nr:MAG TPA: hypothetical protein [Caudoviricetes sp.]
MHISVRENRGSLPKQTQAHREVRINKRKS